MNPRVASFAVLVAVGIMAQAEPVAACSCAGTVPSSIAAQHAEVVFVGTVAWIDGREPSSHSQLNADGSMTVTVDFDNRFPELVVFDVVHAFKGSQSPQIGVLRGNTSCDLPFKPGETWLIFGREGAGGVATDSCSRTRLVSEAAQDLVYLAGVEAGRRQGIVYGEVLRRRNGPSGIALGALFEPLTVVAANEAQKLTAVTDRWGPFELVLPPGNFEIWVQRGEDIVSPKHAIRVADGADLKVHLVVEYSDKQGSTRAAACAR
jgi:hypothetical protein